MNTQTTTDQISLVHAEWAADPADQYFGGPFVDIDEWRDAPVRHRYVHGGFADTETLFSLYFPVAEAYAGRFFQHVTPVPQSENLAPLVTGQHNKIAFAVGSGGYFVETNGGGPNAANPFAGLDPSIGAYRANAAAARFSRVVASTIYGEHRAFGYLYGGSGGAYRTIGASENTDGIWDGFVPYVPGSPMSIPNVFSVRMHAQRILRDRFEEIVDAYDAGGDPASLDLSPEEAAALEEVTRMGFPPRSWFGWKTMGMHAFSVLYPGVMAADPTFAEDFWSVEGYLGADPDASVHRDRVQLDTAIAALVAGSGGAGEDLVVGGVDESYLHTASAGPVATALRLADVPSGWMLGAQLIVRTGAAAGVVLQLSGVEGATVSIEPGQEALVTAIAPGDEVTLDNSGFLAAQTYHRHQVPGGEYAVWDQFREADGTPRYPQRPMLLGPMFTQGAAGTVPTGQITGKMIVVSCLLDREAFPWQADWYRASVEEHLGDSADERFRLWFIDNALHGDDDPQESPDRTVTYLGALEAALRQLAAWVEDGIEPSPTTAYSVEDGQIVVPDSAHDRGGVQPVVRVTVDGAAATTVGIGQAVTVRVDAEAPGNGVIIEAMADFAGTGSLGESLDIAPAGRIVLEHAQAFDTPGTYFVTAQVTAQVDGDVAVELARVQNLARARVIVTA
ncbi:hypothetical protein EV140_0026 [Microcella alkaliphila]|uniref:Tannase/feruloyl esterase family alpha/beta hydrolase n=1 Tax=Microcella alkaliphila TaxID=279828 RepID=A0A4Q7U1W1_9MICO|nr:hypothetical protein [Microcella alkaliphila]RZT66488.1 hypothetical protein EV140_0026 [Microcella alkaliphila]